MTKTTPDPPYTVDEASNALGLSLSAVYGMIDRGDLDRAPVRGKAVLVTAESVQRMKAQRERNGAK